MCSKFRTVSAIFTDIWCIQEPQVAKCWYSNIEQRKWCRTTEIWGIGVNENVRQFFGQCEVNPRSLGWSESHAVDLGFPAQVSGFYVSGFRRISWAEFPAIPDSTGKDLPVSGIWIPYLIRSEISLPTWGEVVFHAYVRFFVINTLIAFT